MAGAEAPVRAQADADKAAAAPGNPRLLREGVSGSAPKDMSASSVGVSGMPKSERYDVVGTVAKSKAVAILGGVGVGCW